MHHPARATSRPGMPQPPRAFRPAAGTGPGPGRRPRGPAAWPPRARSGFLPARTAFARFRPAAPATLRHRGRRHAPRLLPSLDPAQRRRGRARATGAVATAVTAADRLPAPRLATSLTYCRAARGAATWRAGLRLLGELGMRLARLLRGAASAGPAPRTVRSSASRCLTSDSGSGPAPERGVPGQVDFYARFSPSPLSMKQFLDFGECCAGLGPLCAALLASALPSSSTFSFPHPQPLDGFTPS